MGALRDDLGLAYRAVSRRPATNVLVLVSVAVAIGANTAFFGVMRGFILQPLPYPQQDRLVIVWQLARGMEDGDTAVSAPNLLDWRRLSRSFSTLAAFRQERYAVTSLDPPEQVQGARATPDFLPLFGGRARLGRSLRPEDAAPGAPPVVVLGHDYWQRRFAGDPRVVGRTLRIDEREHTIVGVLGRDFSFVQSGLEVWTPLRLDPAAPRDRHEVMVLGRLAPGVSLGAARADLGAIAQRLEHLHPSANHGFGVRVERLRQEIPGPTDRKLFTLVQAAIVLLLLIACANVANLLVARGYERRGEIALRASLGAGRARTVRQLLAESALLGLAASVLGLVLGGLLIRQLRLALAGAVGPALLPTLDLPVVALNAALGVAAVLLFGLGPALATARPDLGSLLRVRGGGVGPRRFAVRALVVAELTLALVMLSATGLLVRSLQAIRDLDPALVPAELLTFRVELPESRYPEDRLASAFEQLRERLAGLPGVTGVSAIDALPRGRNVPMHPFTVDGVEPPPDTQPPSAITLAVAAGYFPTLHIPLRGGRAFTAGDDAAAPAVALVSARFAQRFLGGSAIGRRLAVEGKSREVVGVVGDVVQTRILEEGGPNPIVYLPLAQAPARAMSFVLRCRVPPATLAGAAASEVHRFDGGLVAGDMASLQEHIARQFSGARVLAALVGGFGVVALGLAALGVYGVMAQSVARRRREIGIRMAVGARPADVVREVTAQGATLAGLGLAIGVPGAVLISSALAKVLAGKFPIVWSVLPLVAGVLAATALLASWLPARRAARLDPRTVLAGE